MTIRIDPKIFTQYNEQLITIYGKKHRKKSPIIETLLEQFNNQDAKKLQQYLYQDKPLMNLNLETIKEYKAQIQEKDNTIQSLKQTIQEKNDTITALESSQQEVKASISDKYDDEIQRLQQDIQSAKADNETIKQSLTEKYQQENQSLEATQKRELEILAKDIQSKEHTIQEKDNIIQGYKGTIKEKDNIIQDKDKEIQRLTNELKLSHKDTRTARNDFKHSTETLNKLQKDYNIIQNENKDYAVAFAEVKKMSILEKILSRYPKKFLELSDNVDE